MNTRRLQGLVLVLSAVLFLVVHFAPNNSLFHVLALIGTVLFILGIPAIQAIQPTGAIGWIGIALVELGALIALAFQLSFINNPGMGGVLSMTSAVAGTAGRLIVGWLTTRRSVFPMWVGWAFIAEGLLNYLGGLFNFGPFASLVSLIVILAGAAALFGYGVIIYRRKPR
jgi:hypothetical protein